MGKIIYDKYEKRLIPSLPRVTFDGHIHVIFTSEEAEKAVNYLLTQPILGVDTETRPSFTRGRQYKVALLQVATHQQCFLFRLNLIGPSPAVIRFLEDTTVLKIGLSWHDDLRELKKIFRFTPGYFVDIQNLVKEIGIEDLSLQKLYANLFGGMISKSQQLTNWERETLTDKQKTYAATDAWACINLYEELLRLRQSGDYELHKTQPTQPTIQEHETNTIKES